MGSWQVVEDPHLVVAEAQVAEVHRLADVDVDAAAVPFPEPTRLGLETDGGGGRFLFLFLLRLSPCPALEAHPHLPPGCRAGWRIGGCCGGVWGGGRGGGGGGRGVEVVEQGEGHPAVGGGGRSEREECPGAEVHVGAGNDGRRGGELGGEEGAAAGRDRAAEAEPEVGVRVRVHVAAVRARRPECLANAAGRGSGGAVDVSHLPAAFGGNETSEHRQPWSWTRGQTKLQGNFRGLVWGGLSLITVRSKSGTSLETLLRIAPAYLSSIFGLIRILTSSI